MRRITRWTAACVAAALWTGCATTDGVDAGGDTPAAPAEAVDPMAEMEAFMALNQPGEYHAYMEPLIGTFTASLWSKMTPDGEPMEMSGTMTNSWIMGGRFVQSDFTGEWMGFPFEGLGLTGYDTNKGVYQGLWLDSAGTMLPPASTGSVSDDGKVFTFLREMEDPMKGGMVTMKEVLTIQDADHHSLDMYMSQGGEMFQNMRIEYVRQ